MDFLKLFRPRSPQVVSVPAQGFKHLQPGRRYVVVEAFRDYDRVVHSAGECWQFVTSNFVPYEDGLSLFVRTDDGDTRQIRLQWRPEAQGPVIDALDHFIVEQTGPDGV